MSSATSSATGFHVIDPAVALLDEVQEAIAKTKAPGVTFTAGLLEGSVFIYAVVFPYGESDASGVTQGHRGTYHWLSRKSHEEGKPLAPLLYRVAKNVYEDMLRDGFTFDGHRPHAKRH